MKYSIKEYDLSHVKSMAGFNKRLKEAGVKHQFPERAYSEKLPKINGRKVYIEYFILFDEQQITRGAYVLKHQQFYIGGNSINIANCQLPLSEGIIDSRYVFVGLLLLKDALKRQQRLFALGLGGMNEKWPQLLKGFGWELFLIPFYFKVINSKNFLNNIEYLKKKKYTRLLIKLLNFSGLVAVGTKLLNFYFMKNNKLILTEFEVVNNFSKWTDDLWEDAKSQYYFVAKRDSETLNILYPTSEKKYIRLKIWHDEKIIGWCLLLKTRLSNHKQLGNMYLGSLVDCLSLPTFEHKIVQCALDYFKQTNVDLIVSNQSASGWCTGLKFNGFIKGPSNFVFAMSKRLSSDFINTNNFNSHFHLNRGDGDGPMNL